MNEFVEKIGEKFNYTDDLKNVIRVSMALMVEEYGTEEYDSICEFLEDVRIFLTNDMSSLNLKHIQDKIVPTDERLIEEQQSIYGNEKNPGSVYSYQTIYDEQMNPSGEYRWIVVEDLKGTIREEKYQSLFGTTINLPYFLHELNHAYNMQRPTYQRKGNKIYSKHGMYEEIFDIKPQETKVNISLESSKNLIIEEAINELQTQRMLCSYFNVEEYSEVRKKLNAIGHVSPSYDGIVVFLGQCFEKLIGKSNLLKYRKENEISIIEEFNKVISQSRIADHNNFKENGYEKFGQLCYELFQLKCNCYKYSLEEYGVLMEKMQHEALGPLYAYVEVTRGTMTLEEYESQKETINDKQQQK